MGRFNIFFSVTCTLITSTFIKMTLEWKKYLPKRLMVLCDKSPSSDGYDVVVSIKPFCILSEITNKL